MRLSFLFFSCLLLLFFSRPIQAFNFLIKDNLLSYKQLNSLAKADQIETINAYRLDLEPSDEKVLSFNYRIESTEDLQVFDQPALYISLDNEIIFSSQSWSKDWQAVVLNLKDFEFSGQELVFQAANLGDSQRRTKVIISDLNWKNETDEKIENINKLECFIERDHSLTLVFEQAVEEIEYNWRYFLTCDGHKFQLVQNNFYLLADYEISALWPNLAPRTLINIKNHPCESFNNLALERQQ